MRSRPTAFLCHASEDSALAERIARDLQQAGIDTFFDQWSISAGQSLRGRIDEGLEGCTHFIVLLTQISIGKPWVKAEIDAAFVRKIRGLARLLPIRFGLDVDQLTPLLAGLYAPSITEDTYEASFRRLAGEIYELSTKPPLGETPEFAKRSSASQTGLSFGAEKIAKLLLNRSERGRPRDPRMSVKDIVDTTVLTVEELEIAVDELESKSLVKPCRVIGCPPLGYEIIEPTQRLFVDFDRHFMAWNPREDALRVAAEVVNSKWHWLSTDQLSVRLQWTPRRLNPALAFLIRHGAVSVDKSIDALFIATGVGKNGRTRRFLHDR